MVICNHWSHMAISAEMTRKICEKDRPYSGFRPPSSLAVESDTETWFISRLVRSIPVFSEVNDQFAVF